MRLSNQMDPSNDKTVQTETTPPLYQRDELLKDLEEDMDRIREARIETEQLMKDQLMAQLGESYTKMEKLLAEITSTRQTITFSKSPCLREHQNASQEQRCENEDSSPENTKHETEDAGKTSEL
ncbi:uncharacterized protein TrAtP1_002936 [Trichoderma atroviride]|uniref:uncharacterized protein n=1 Tax=Hypocrea atroviridis TaxID=63577 RepID=UPI0033274697|nr:hypothetical protein TrAtP1_002936 [Trichoderma atroviride]